MRRSTAVLVVLLALLAVLTTGASAQRRKPTTSPTGSNEETLLTIQAKIGGKSYQGSGSGDCKHAAEASIHDLAASLWMIQYASTKDGSIKQLNLTLWRPKDGSPDRLSLSLETKSSSHRIRTGPSGEQLGEGTVTILPSGPGGRLEVSGKEASGKPVQITIECSAFGDVAADGG